MTRFANRSLFLSALILAACGGGGGSGQDTAANDTAQTSPTTQPPTPVPQEPANPIPEAPPPAEPGPTFSADGRWMLATALDVGERFTGAFSEAVVDRNGDLLVGWVERKDLSTVKKSDFRVARFDVGGGSWQETQRADDDRPRSTGLFSLAFTTPDRVWPSLFTAGDAVIANWTENVDACYGMLNQTSANGWGSPTEYDAQICYNPFFGQALSPHLAAIGAVVQLTGGSGQAIHFWRELPDGSFNRFFEKLNATAYSSDTGQWEDLGAIVQSSGDIGLFDVASPASGPTAAGLLYVDAPLAPTTSSIPVPPSPPFRFRLQLIEFDGTSWGPVQTITESDETVIAANRTDFRPADRISQGRLAYASDDCQPVVAWLREDLASGLFAVEAARRGNADWTVTQLTDGLVGRVSDFALEAGPDGQLIAAWIQGDSRQPHIRHFTPATGWQPMITVPSDNAMVLSLAVTPDGRATILWQGPDTLEEVHYQPGIGWSEVGHPFGEALGNCRCETAQYRLVSNASGQISVAWDFSPFKTGPIHAAILH